MISVSTSTKNIQPVQATITAPRLEEMVSRSVRSRDGARSIQLPIQEDKHIEAKVLHMPLLIYQPGGPLGSSGQDAPYGGC